MTLPAYGFEDALYALGQPQALAEFKTVPADFVVEEVLGFEPAGEGEHLFLQLQTDDQNTRFTLQILAKLFGVAQKQVSYSGLKDRRGLTSQWFSIHLPGKQVTPDADQLLQNGITLLQHSRHNKKLRIGTHKANRFHIILRNVTSTETLAERITSVAAGGVPNYFGPQRFGHGGQNIAQALHWLEKAELPFERELRGRVLSTLRAWLFNGILSQRLQQQTWQTWQQDDPVMLDGTHSFFQPDAWDEVLQQRYEQGDIHLATWLFCNEHPGVAPENIQRYLGAAQFSTEIRALRLIPQELQWRCEANTLQLEFNLPTGAYATSVLRELVQLIDRSLPVSQ